MFLNEQTRWRHSFLAITVRRSLIPLPSRTVRINLAPTVGYEKDAGSHTTHHFMYPESAKNLAANVSFVLVPFKTLDLVWITSALSTGQIRL